MKNPFYELIQVRKVEARLRMLQHAQRISGNVSQTCRGHTEFGFAFLLRSSRSFFTSVRSAATARFEPVCTASIRI